MTPPRAEILCGDMGRERMTCDGRKKGGRS